jgi:hypothetical protein
VHHAVAADSAVAIVPSKRTIVYNVYSWFVVVDHDKMRFVIQNQLRLVHPECLGVASSVISSYFGGRGDVFCVVEPFLECCCCISGP